jgi:hypothetical protein
MIRVRSAGPLISKFLNNEFARKRSRVSSIMSAWDGSAVVTMSTRDDCDALMLRTDGCWPPYPGSNGQNGGVADLSGIWIFVEGGVVGLLLHYQDDIGEIRWQTDSRAYWYWIKSGLFGTTLLW